MSCRKAFNILSPNCITRDRQLFILITLPLLSLAGPTGPLQVFPCLLFLDSYAFSYSYHHKKCLCSTMLVYGEGIFEANEVQ